MTAVKAQYHLTVASYAERAKLASDLHDECARSDRGEEVDLVQTAEKLNGLVHALNQDRIAISKTKITQELQSAVQAHKKDLIGLTARVNALSAKANGIPEWVTPTVYTAFAAGGLTLAAVAVSRLILSPSRQLSSDLYLGIAVENNRGAIPVEETPNRYTGDPLPNSIPLDAIPENNVNNQNTILENSYIPYVKIGFGLLGFVSFGTALLLVGRHYLNKQLDFARGFHDAGGRGGGGIPVPRIQQFHQPNPAPAPAAAIPAAAAAAAPPGNPGGAPQPRPPGFNGHQQAGGGANGGNGFEPDAWRANAPGGGVEDMGNVGGPPHFQQGGQPFVQQYLGGGMPNPAAVQQAAAAAARGAPQLIVQGMNALGQAPALLGNGVQVAQAAQAAQQALPLLQHAAFAAAPLFQAAQLALCAAAPAGGGLLLLEGAGVGVAATVGAPIAAVAAAGAVAVGAIAGAYRFFSRN